MEDSALVQTIIQILVFVVSVFVLIQGLKNSFPFIAKLFVDHPKLGLYLNVAAAFATQAILCLRVDPFVLLDVGKCLLTALFQIFGASGVHALYKAWLAKGSIGMKTLADGGNPLSDSVILTPMREARR